MFKSSHVRRAAPAAPLAILILAASLVAATAATNPVGRGAGAGATNLATQTAQITAPAPAVAASVTDAAPACLTARRKLWIEGDGWVIRRVPLCAGGGLGRE